MMIEEFEKRTGIFPDMETYRVIEAYYCEFDGDKDAFRDEVGRWLPPGIGEGFEKAMPDAVKDMQLQAKKMVAKMQTAVSASAGSLNLNASGAASARALTTTGTSVYYDQRMEQQNTYNVPVATPSEVSKAQREALRNIVGGVK